MIYNTLKQAMRDSGMVVTEGIHMSPADMAASRDYFYLTGKQFSDFLPHSVVTIENSALDENSSKENATDEDESLTSQSEEIQQDENHGGAEEFSSQEASPKEDSAQQVNPTDCDRLPEDLS